jgi:hypothetical protein
MAQVIVDNCRLRRRRRRIALDYRILKAGVGKTFMSFYPLRSSYANGIQDFDNGASGRALFILKRINNDGTVVDGEIRLMNPAKNTWR